MEALPAGADGTRCGNSAGLAARAPRSRARLRNAAERSTFPKAVPETSPTRAGESAAAASAASTPTQTEAVTWSKRRERAGSSRSRSASGAGSRAADGSAYAVLLAPASAPAGPSVATPVTTNRERAARSGRGRGAAAARSNASTAPVPPNPNELESAARSSARSPSPRTWRSGSDGSGDSRPPVGGATPCSSASTVKAASRAPAAPRVWPICPFDDDTRTRVSSSPNTPASARASIASFWGVAVPWAFT